MTNFPNFCKNYVICNFPPIFPKKSEKLIFQKIGRFDTKNENQILKGARRSRDGGGDIKREIVKGVVIGKIASVLFLSM